MKTNRLITKELAQSLDLPSRIQLESELTDAIAEDARFPVIPPDWSFEQYTSSSPWRKRIFDHLGPLQGKTILDIGCGYHPTPVYFALAGAKHVVACDVSKKALEYVAKVASENNVAERITISQSPVEELPFDDGEVDLIHGESVLHHLDIPRASTEIARVLKSGGRAAFKDPLGHNVFLEFDRD